MSKSKTHQVFAKSFEIYSKENDAIDYPDKYLWPNTNLVLDFWEYLDSLSHDDMDAIRNKVKVPISSRDHNLSKLAEEVVGEKVLRCLQVSTGTLVYLATCELLSYHHLLNLGRPAEFIPLFEGFQVKKVRPYHIMPV